MILQHTPRAVTVAPSLLVIVPPQLAVVCVILLTDEVERIGILARVVNEISFP